MRYAGIMPNDMLNGQGVCVSVWMQGCPHHCPECHNPETWDYGGGYEITIENLINKIDKALTANGIKRNLSILGGEPLCETNIFETNAIIDWCRNKYPEIKIYLWTGYVYDNCNPNQLKTIAKTDVTIEGPYIKEFRDITLPLCGSRNQRVLKKGFDF